MKSLLLPVFVLTGIHFDARLLLLVQARPNHGTEKQSRHEIDEYELFFGGGLKDFEEDLEDAARTQRE